jgi:hypothetical protein
LGWAWRPLNRPEESLAHVENVLRVETDMLQALIR